MKLSDLIDMLDFNILQGNVETPVLYVTSNSKNVKPSTAFVCIVGAVSNGHSYISSAIENGANAIVVQAGEALPEIPQDITVVEVENTRKAIAIINE